MTTWWREGYKKDFWVFNPLLTWCDGWLTLRGEGVWVEARLWQQPGVSAAATVIIPLTPLGATAVVRIPLHMHWITRVYPATANRCHRTLHRLFSRWVEMCGDKVREPRLNWTHTSHAGRRCDSIVAWTPFVHIRSSKAWHNWYNSAPSQYGKRGLFQQGE